MDGQETSLMDCTDAITNYRNFNADVTGDLFNFKLGDVSDLRENPSRYIPDSIDPKAWEFHFKNTFGDDYCVKLVLDINLAGGIGVTLENLESQVWSIEYPKAFAENLALRIIQYFVRVSI